MNAVGHTHTHACRWWSVDTAACLISEFLIETASVLIV